MRNYPTTILSADDTKSETGSAIFVGQAVAASFTMYASADAAGTIKLQANNDPPVGDPLSFTPASGHWVDITSATMTVASGTSAALVLSTMNFQYIRAVYTRASGGSSSIVVNMSALGV